MALVLEQAVSSMIGTRMNKIDDCFFFFCFIELIWNVWIVHGQVTISVRKNNLPQNEQL